MSPRPRHLAESCSSGGDGDDGDDGGDDDDDDDGGDDDDDDGDANHHVTIVMMIIICFMCVLFLLKAIHLGGFDCQSSQSICFDVWKMMMNLM